MCRNAGRELYREIIKTRSYENQQFSFTLACGFTNLLTKYHNPSSMLSTDLVPNYSNVAIRFFIPNDLSSVRVRRMKGQTQIIFYCFFCRVHRRRIEFLNGHSHLRFLWNSFQTKWLPIRKPVNIVMLLCGKCSAIYNCEFSHSSESSISFLFNFSKLLFLIIIQASRMPRSARRRRRALTTAA